MGSREVALRAHYKLVLVEDPDHGSRHPELHEWSSHTRVFDLFVKDSEHNLTRFPSASVTDGVSSRDRGKPNWSADRPTWVFEEPSNSVQPYRTRLSYKNRSMELSSLLYHDSVLYAFCDITGIVYELQPSGVARQRWILHDGDEESFSTKPFKSEWSTLQGGSIVVGSIGKEWVTDGKVLHYYPQSVQLIDPATGNIRIKSFRGIYEAMREESNHTYPGYLIHESGHFHKATNEWWFLPRKASREGYDETVDELKGTNLFYTVNEHSKKVTVNTLGPLEPEWGFSDFVVLPGDPHHIVALKVRERAGEPSHSKMAVFDTRRHKMVSPWVDLGPHKYEGIELRVQPLPSSSSSS